MIMKTVYNIIQLEDKKDEIDFISPTKPIKEFNINEFNIPNNRQKVKVQEYLSKVLAFIDMKKQVRFTDKEGGFTVMNISCKNKRLLSMFGYQPARVSSFITYMITIGLLAEYDEKYQFNAFYAKNNKCKSYIYSYSTECKIKEYCINNNINKYQIRNYNIYNSYKLQPIDNFDKASVRFNSKLSFLKPENWSERQFEEYLTACLYENYPWFEEYQKKADLINDVYYADDVDRQIQFVPTFTWGKGNKRITKIGIRATNCLVSAKKEDDENKLTRKDVLDRYGLKYEFDVKSSVPRITYLLNNGTWLDNSIDLYEVMFENFIKRCPSEATEWNEETRNIFKSFHMRGYFDTYSMISGHIKRELGKKIDYKKDDWKCLDFIMKSYKEAIEETIGQEYDSEIFFHESCIYMDVLFELLKQGYNVWQCYDCWYTDKEVSNINDIINDKVYNYYYNTKYNNIYNSYKLQNEEEATMEDCKQVHTNVTEKDVFGLLLDFEEGKLTNKEKAIPKDCTNYNIEE